MASLILANCSVKVKGHSTHNGRVTHRLGNPNRTTMLAVGLLAVDP